MISVALLRGINVGGKNKVEMPRLRDLFEALGMGDVATYINTGNVVFSHPKAAEGGLPSRIEAAIEEEFGLSIPVLVRSGDTIQAIANAIPADWVHGAEMKTNAIYLWDDIDEPGVLDDIPVNPDVDEVRYTPGALLWRVDAEHATRSRLNKLVGLALYRSMTIRNANTARKLAELVSE